MLSYSTALEALRGLVFLPGTAYFFYVGQMMAFFGRTDGWRRLRIILYCNTVDWIATHGRTMIQ
jgi:hypothetical protein